MLIYLVVTSYVYITISLNINEGENVERFQRLTIPGIIDGDFTFSSLNYMEFFAYNLRKRKVFVEIIKIKYCFTIAKFILL